jgi:fructose-1,6-bisphosphatase/inositol monophosphatase family enzyme
MAAGSVLVEEAGGTASGLDGARLRLGRPGIAAANRRIHAELIAALAD